MPVLCRDCGAAAEWRRCTDCGSPRVIAHPELDTLRVAHIHCDAFYAAIGKRDDPTLRASPVVVERERDGWGKRVDFGGGRYIKKKKTTKV